GQLAAGHVQLGRGLSGRVRITAQAGVRRSLERDEELAVRALEAEVAGGAAPLDRLSSERLVAVRALDLERPLLLDPAHESRVPGGAHRHTSERQLPSGQPR